MNSTRNRRLVCRAAALAVFLLFPAAAKAQPPSIGPGSPWVLAPYFYTATTETVISVTGTGPFTLEHVNPANDPSRAFPYRP